MGLTGQGTLWCTVASFVLITVATCLMWNRVWHPVRWPARIGLLAASDIAAVLVVALLLNSTFDFYLSWSELLGTHPTLVGAVTVAGSQDARWRTGIAAAAASGHGLVVPLEIPGGAGTGISGRPAMVYLPPQYGQPRYAHAQFPVIELLDGVPGSPESWLKSLNIATVLDRGIATGELAPTVVVMPTQNVDSPRDTECADVVRGPQVDTYLTSSVRVAVDHAFRVSPSGSDWAVTGYSTGAYCATLFAAQHPGMFAAAASIEGYNKAQHDPTTGSLFQGSTTLTDHADLLWWILHRPASKVPILALSTKQDTQSWVDDRILDRIAAEHGWPVSQLTLPLGGHNFGTFTAEVPLALNWLGRHLGSPLTPTPSIDGLAPHPVGPSDAGHRTTHRRSGVMTASSRPGR